MLKTRFRKIAAGTLAVFVALVVIASLAPEEDERDAASPAQASAEVVTTEPAAAEKDTVDPRVAARQEAARAQRRRAEARRAAEQARRAAAREARRLALANRGKTISGSGSQVKPLTLGRDDVAVFRASNGGGSNFIVDVTDGAGGSTNIFNEIGPGAWEAASAAVSGRFKLSVDAEGSWTINVSQPVPGTKAKRFPGAISNSGSRVIAINVPQEIPAATISARNSGGSNFVVQVYGYGGVTQGEALIFNEIGPGTWQTVETFPEGQYLLAVQAEGNWTLRVAR